MSLIRGVLLAGKFRTQHELNRMTHDDQRNTLIVELAKHSNQANYQSFDDTTLAGMGAVMVFLRETGIRNDEGLRMMNADDQRNTLIVEIGAQTGIGSQLQQLTNMELVLVGLGGRVPWDSVHRPSYIRGVLLAGKFRTQHELNQMSDEDQRNTLIVELTNHSNQANYQSFDDHQLAGMGAVMVLLRATGIRTDDTLIAMSADDQRNTLIVELNGQTGLGARLQSLQNMDLVRLALGADAEPMFRGLPAPLQPRPDRRLQFRLRDFVVFRSTDDTFQGVRDEVYISAIGLDSSRTFVGAAGAATDQIQGPVIGDIASDDVRGPWREKPFPLIEFDLDHPGPTLDIPLTVDGPTVHRVFTVILMVVEEDSEGVGDTFNELKDTVRDKLNEIINAAAHSLLDSTGTSAGQVVAPVLGSAIGGAVGSFPGAIAGYIATLALGELFSAISEGLANEVFTPKPLRLVLPHPLNNMLPDEHDRPDWIEFKEHDALYRLTYDWHVE